MPEPDTSRDGLRSTNSAEHISDAKSKKVTLRQFIPATGEWVNISAVESTDTAGVYGLVVLNADGSAISAGGAADGSFDFMDGNDVAFMDGNDMAFMSG